MDLPSLILGKLIICDSKGQRWCESYNLATVDVIQAKSDFLALCRYRAACLASENSLVRGHLEFVNDHRPSILLIEESLPSPWSVRIGSLLNIAIECRFETSQGKSVSTCIHGVGRTGPRTGFLTSVQAVFEPNAIPGHEALTSPENGFRAFVSFLRDKTIYARMNKSGKVMGKAPWKSVIVNDFDLEAEVEFLIDEKENTDMLPMLPRLSSMFVGGHQKSIKVVQVGPLRLYFQLSRKHEKMSSPIVAFHVDGEPPCVCQRAGERVMTDKYLAHIEGDRSKWLPEHEFVSKWLETSKKLLGGTSA